MKSAALKICLLVTVMAFLLNACEKAEKTSSEFRVISKELFDNTPYNRDLSNFSKTVCKALAENKVFSSIIHNKRGSHKTI